MWSLTRVSFDMASRGPRMSAFVVGVETDGGGGVGTRMPMACLKMLIPFTMLCVLRCSM